MILQISRELDELLNQFSKGKITKDTLEEKRQELYSKINEKENDFMEKTKVMRSTGITRQLDNLGRIVLPMELRRVLDLKKKDSLEIFVEGDNIILRKYQPGCTFCGSMDGLMPFGGKHVCIHCRKVMAKNV